MKLLMIDNYDSFTYNLVQYFGELGAEVEVFRNDEITVEELGERIAAGVGRLVISPGPCSPAEAGISVEAIKAFRRQAADPRRLPGPPGDRRGLRRPDHPCAAADARQDQRDHDHARGRVRRAAREIHRQPLPLAVHRARRPARASSRSPPGPTTARSWACATPASRRRCASRACSSIRNPSSPSTAMPCSRTSWSEAMSRSPGRPAQRHRHPAHRGDARSHVRGPAGRRRVRRRPERQRAAGADRRDAGLRGGAVRAHRHAEQLLRRSSPTASAATSTSWARWRTATAGKAAARRCSAACSRSRSTTSRTARWR